MTVLQEPKYTETDTVFSKPSASFLPYQIQQVVTRAKLLLTTVNTQLRNSLNLSIAQISHTHSGRWWGVTLLGGRETFNSHHDYHHHRERWREKYLRGLASLRRLSLLNWTWLAPLSSYLYFGCSRVHFITAKRGESNKEDRVDVWQDEAKAKTCSCH